MAGHSKWANIKHRKARQDAVKGKVFTKFIREITVAARLGGPIEAENPRLRAIVSKALGANMSRDVVNRAIARGSNSDDGKDLHEITYEGYGVQGVAVLVECMTDNVNRTVAEVRHAFAKTGGNLGTNGSVSYLFNQRGEIEVLRTALPEESLMELALEADAEDFKSEPQGYEILTEPAAFEAVHKQIEAKNIKYEAAEITSIPTVTVPLNDETAIAAVNRLIEALEEHDDVKEVHFNADFAAEVAKA